MPGPPNIQLMTDPRGTYRDRHVIETQYMTAVLLCDEKNLLPPSSDLHFIIFPWEKNTSPDPHHEDQGRACGDGDGLQLKQEEAGVP